MTIRFDRFARLSLLACAFLAAPALAAAPAAAQDAQPYAEAPAAAPAPSAGQGEAAAGASAAARRLTTQPASGLPARQAPPRTLRAYWHVFVAYALAWALLFGYVVHVARKFGRVERELEALRAP